MRTALLAFMLCLHGTSFAIDVKDVEPDKRTVLDRYLTAGEAWQMLSGRAHDTLFIDVRTQAEVSYVGAPAGMDANVPFMLVDFDYFDPKARRFALHKNPDFVKRIGERLQSKGLDRNADIVLICRSGDRTARAVNALAAAGYTRVWTVIDGFEGDPAGDGANAGKRTVNGWKNAGLPWSYVLERSQAYVSGEP
ncbi:MAG: rhodanese [Gammaproteobacteria bacterium]|jgi:rhodanese-related sulfurtransferase|nr:rhodanese [Gammaproteobacteria bacterium]MBU0772750.1 rhodanese [Gammaproteobacteria bacterium]MBU0855678.1 rhodanese [Gammaproteobacteria bacterium]MBU1847053.1 rhodanese [Gammaproteobacteria bacterium]